MLFGVGCVSLILVSETDSAPPDSETPRESGTAKVSGERKTVADQPKNVSAALAPLTHVVGVASSGVCVCCVRTQ